MFFVVNLKKKKVDKDEFNNKVLANKNKIGNNETKSHIIIGFIIPALYFSQFG